MLRVFLVKAFENAGGFLMPFELGEQRGVIQRGGQIVRVLFDMPFELRGGFFILLQIVKLVSLNLRGHVGFRAASRLPDQQQPDHRDEKTQVSHRLSCSISKSSQSPTPARLNTRSSDQGIGSCFCASKLPSRS